MPGRVAGKVAFITGAARGQGRSHAIRLAEEGADIIAVDILEDYESVPYGMATRDDLAETARAVEALDRAIPHLIASGGGSIIAISSAAGVKGYPYTAPYVAAKFGVTGIVKAMANELAEHHIRVNSIHPTGVRTPMADGLHPHLTKILEEHPYLGPMHMNAMPDVDAVDPVDISNAVLFLACDESRFVTGLEMRVDAGNTIR